MWCTECMCVACVYQRHWDRFDVNQPAAIGFSFVPVSVKYMIDREKTGEKRIL